MTLPEGALAARYYAEGHWRSEDLWTSFAARAAAAPDRTALVAVGAALTFGALAARAEQLGRGLLARGIGPGELVLIHGRNKADAVTALLGCAWAGAVMAPVPPLFSAAQVAAIAERAEARAVFALGNAAERERAVAGAAAANVGLVVSGEGADGTLPFEALLAEAAGSHAPRRPVPADALALVTYSSGTTGSPKGVMHSANTLRYGIEARAAMHGVEPGETCIVVSQFGFVGGTVFGLLAGALLGTTSVLMPSWNAEEALELIARHRVGYGHFMPTHVHDLLTCPALDRTDVTSLRRAAMGGLSPERRREVMRRLCPLPLPGYGMSECLGHASCAPGDPEEKRLGRDGRPYPGTEILIVGPDGQKPPAGETGAILARGPSRCLGYYRAPELSAAAFTPDGFYCTGDLGMLDADGYLTFIGREKDIIRRGGVTIAPAEVEAALLAHPRIRQAAIVGLPDPRLGERACACIVTRDGAPIGLAELTAFLGGRGVARYLWPERVALFDALPLTPSLKVRKPDLVAHLASEAGSGG
ncbi:MAG TPA: AMP-binding protein [Paracoccaceae bacterium]|nr:AMP-binding protein [Paracoccaceae bacterium]